jgi:hypothetical protein
MAAAGAFGVIRVNRAAANCRNRVLDEAASFSVSVDRDLTSSSSATARR